MTSAENISIVIPVYNRQDLVSRTLASIEAQTFRPLNVILVDNASTDGTLAVLNAWAQRVAADGIRVRVTTEGRPGAAAARNVGLRLVETPWVMFFDSDDTMAPDHIARIERAIASGVDGMMPDIIGWDVRLHDRHGRKSIKGFSTTGLMYNCLIHGTFATQRYACRTEMVRGIGAWKGDVMVWNDIEMATRLLTGYPDVRVAKLKGSPRVDVYHTEESITGPSMYSKGAEREHALKSMATIMSPSKRPIADLKGMILAANYSHEGHKKDAKRLRRSILSRQNVWMRMLLSCVYSYTALGLPGAGRFVKPFFR